MTPSLPAPEPAPRDVAASVRTLAVELAGHLGVPGFVAACVELLGGADRRGFLDLLPYLSGHPVDAGAALRDPARWPDPWIRTWGARGLLHVWDDAAGDAVLAGLADPAWRPAEMCLKVAARHEVGGAGDGAVLLAEHRLPRVRAQAVRTLGAVGDTEHLRTVRAALDDPAGDVRRQAARALERLARRLDLPDEREH